LQFYITSNLLKWEIFLHFAETARQKTILPFCVKYFAELEIFRMCKAKFRRNSKTENYLAVLCEIFCRIGDIPHV
jgi:hypothetical protein